MHMQVVFVDPGKTIRMTGGLGPLQSMAVNGAMTIMLKQVATGTQCEIIYTVGGYSISGFENIAPLVDRVLGEQCKRFKAYEQSLSEP